MQNLEGNVAVVTGAASGIGLGMTEAFAHRGMKVVMADVEERALNAEAERLHKANLQVTPIVCDVSDYASVERLRDAAIAAYGAVHVLCNNAGVGGGGPGPIWQMSPKDWDWVMGVNFYGVVNGLRAFVPYMLAHGNPGHVVNTASILGLTSGAGSIYGVSKHAVVRLTEGLFHDLKSAQANIGASVLCPGLIATNIITSARNRPTHLTNTEAAANEQRAQAMSEMDKYFKTSGKPPREVGDLVADAIVNEQFYVLTHPENMQGVQRRFDDIVNLRPPSPPQRGIGG